MRVLCAGPGELRGLLGSSARGAFASVNVASSPKKPKLPTTRSPSKSKMLPNFPAEPRDHQQPIENPLEISRSRSFRSDDRSSRQRVPLIAGASSRPSHSSACRPRKTVSSPLFLSPRKSILDRAGREGAPAERRLPHIKVRFFYTRRSVIVVLFSACGSHGESPRQRASRRATPVRRERGRVWIVWSGGSRRHSRAGAPRRPCESLSSCPRLSFLALCSVE